MKTKCCEKCGKEFGFFDFKHEIKNDRLNLHYDCLCGKCYRILNAGIERIDALYADMIKILKERLHTENMAAVDIDTLIFLAAEVIFKNVPDYDQSSSNIQQALINGDGRSSEPEDDLCKIVELLIDYGFAMNKKNAQVMDFRNYFKRMSLFCEQVGMNRKEDIPKSYHQLFLTCRGLVAKHMETGESFSITVEEDALYLFEGMNETELLLKSMHYPDEPERNLILYPINEDQTKKIISAFKQFNDITARRKARKRRDTISVICRGIYKDLKKIKPDERFSKIPMDCLLIFIVKNIMEDPIGKKMPMFGENSILMDILFENFYDNLTSFGRTTRPEILEYIQKNTLLSEGFYIQYGKKEEKGWGFFTTKGYILGFLASRKYVFVFEDVLPNDIYYPCNDLVYKGCRYLQLAEKSKDSESSGSFRRFDGLIFFSSDMEKMGKMNRFFNLNSILYVMDRYVEAEAKVFASRETLLEVKRVSDKLFGEFSYLPFCQYDEWAAILEKLKEDDFLLCQLIDHKSRGQKFRPAAATTYTIRIIKAFNRCAKELENTLHFGDLSITKAILWGYFNESLIDTFSREWIRIAGDIVRSGDTIEDAFEKYFNMAEIDSGKSYYLGLYVYYLMSKEILPEDDFLENYETCIRIYRKYNQRVEEIRLKRVMKERARPVKEGLEWVTTKPKAMVSKSEQKDFEPTEKAESKKAVNDGGQIDINEAVDLTDGDEGQKKSVLEDIKKNEEDDNSETLDPNTHDALVSDHQKTSEPLDFSAEGMKNAKDILAEKAAKSEKNEKPIRRIIENEE